MDTNFVVDWTPGLDAAVLIYNPQERRYELTLVDTSTRAGRIALALFKKGRNFVWAWQPIAWSSGPVH
jgi:hypothetical protein